MDETIFERILRWGAELGWNKTQIAARLGMKPNHFNNWKYKGVSPKRYTQIAALFGRSVEELVGTGPERSAPEGFVPAIWPLDTIDPRKIEKLNRRVRDRLEGAFLLAASQLGVDITNERHPPSFPEN